MCRDGFKGNCPQCGHGVTCREEADFMCADCYEGCHEDES
mgnify:CR=1 FL=1